MTNIDDVLYAPIACRLRQQSAQARAWGRPDDPDRIKSNTSNLRVVLEDALVPALAQFLFELNNKITRQSVIESVSGVLGRQEGLHEYWVVCDETNNSGETIANNQLAVDVWYQPNTSIEEVEYFRVTLGG